MPYLFLLGSICCSAAISLSGTLYNNRTAELKNVSKFYSFLVSCSVTIAWLVIYIFDFSFDPGVLLYSMGYGAFYAMFTIGLISALKTGSVSLTAFVKQISLVGVSFWGFFFWDTPFTVNVAIGLVLIVAALYLCVNRGGDTSGEKFSLKWALFALMVAAGNAGCSIVQKYEQIAFNGQHGTMMMLFATAFAAILNLLLALREDRAQWKAALKKAWFCPAGAGMGSALSNRFILLLMSTSLPASLIYPGVAVGGLMLTVLVSVVAFHEKLTRKQWIGLGVGAVALVFLNL